MLRDIFSVPASPALLAPQAKENTYRWAEVLTTDPLTIRLDGDDDPLGITPASLVQTEVGDRVWCQLYGRRVIVLGAAARPPIPPPVPEWTNIGDVGAPAFLNSWSNLGGIYAVGRFMLWDHIVYIEGVLTGGAGTLPAFVLPAGFRPGGALMLAQPQNNNVMGRMNIEADGTVTPIFGAGGTNGYFSITCDFPADQ